MYNSTKPQVTLGVFHKRSNNFFFLFTLFGAIKLFRNKDHIKQLSFCYIKGLRRRPPRKINPKNFCIYRNNFNKCPFGSRIIKDWYALRKPSKCRCDRIGNFFIILNSLFAEEHKLQRYLLLFFASEIQVLISLMGSQPV